jgi:hypothetical protein
MKLMFEGWWDQMRMRKGWSNKIGKWQWVALQTIFPVIITSPFLIWMASKFDDYSYEQSIWFISIFFPFMALSFSGRWNQDQKEIAKEQNEG